MRITPGPPGVFYGSQTTAKKPLIFIACIQDYAQG